MYSYKTILKNDSKEIDISAIFWRHMLVWHYAFTVAIVIRKYINKMLLMIENE